MRLDNSAVQSFWTCPLKFYERYVANIEPATRSEPLEFGKRVHRLLEGRLDSPRGSGEPLKDVDLEAEAQGMFAAYENQWGPLAGEPFEVIEVERLFEIPVEGHTFVGKFDGIIEADGDLWVFEHKTEKRGSRKNAPEAWAARPQVSLYSWAAERIYGRPVKGVLLDVLTRRSPKGVEPELFRRDRLVRTRAQREQVVREMVYVADRLEELKDRPVEEWPANRNECHSGFWKCPYYDLHVFGRDENTLRAFRPAEEYLTTGGGDGRGKEGVPGHVASTGGGEQRQCEVLAGVA